MIPHNFSSKVFPVECLSLIKCLTAALLVISANQLNAQEHFTLEQARTYAMTHNYSMRQSLLDESIAKKKVNETTAIGLPKISGSFGFQNFMDLPTTLIPATAFNPMAPADEFAEVQFGTEYNSSASLTASQLLFDGSYIVGLQAASAYRAFSALQTEKNATDVNAQVSQAYFTVLISRENSRVLDSSINAMALIRDESAAVAAEGLMDKTNADQLALSVNTIKSRLLKARRQELLSLSLLKLTMGIPQGDSIVLDDDLNSILENAAPEKKLLATYDLNANISYRLLSANEHLMKLDLKRQYMAYLPTMSAFISHSQNQYSNNFSTFDPDVSWYPTTVWGINLNVPIFDFGITMSRVAESKLALEKAKIQLQQVEEGLKVTERQVRSDLATAWALYNNEKDNFSLAGKIYRQQAERLRQGIGSSMDLAQAQTQFLNAQGKLIAALFELLNTKNKFDKELTNFK